MGLALWPYGLLWPCWVCFSFSFSPQPLTSLLSCAHLPSGLLQFPWPCAPSFQASPWTRKCLHAHTQFLCLCVCTCPWIQGCCRDTAKVKRTLNRRDFNFWSLGIWNAKHSGTFHIFLCAVGSMHSLSFRSVRVIKVISGKQKFIKINCIKND